MKANLRSVLGASAAAVVLLFAGAALGAPPRPPALVAVSPAVEQEVELTRSFIGTVMPSKTAVIGSAVDGRVIEFPFNAGDRVEANQPLAQLLTDTVKLELAAAKAELELRRYKLAELEHGSRPEEIEQAKARQVAADARKTFVEAQRKRAEKLFEEGEAISEEERDEAVSLSIAADQLLVESKASLKLMEAGPRIEQIEQARAEVAVQEALVKELEDRVTKHTIVSRFAGYVTTEHTEVGQWVQQGDPVAEVVALDEVEVVAQVPEQYVGNLRVGLQVELEVPAIKDRTFTGKVIAIVPQGDVQARTFPVKVGVVNEMVGNEPLLKAGMYARVNLPLGEKQLALLVPKDALVLGGASPLVYVVDPAKDSPPSPANTPPAAQSGSNVTASDASAGVTRPVPVKLGVAIDKLIQVIGPLKSGELVVTQGNERLRPGQPVQVQRVIEVSDAATTVPSAAPRR